MKTKADRPEIIKKKWDEAERGEDGLKRIAWKYFEILPAHSVAEHLTEPVVLTADGIEQCVVMSFEGYKSVKFTPKARMARIQGVLYREVV